jgi:DNA-binding transcriptional ArsR family regulator
MLPEELFRVLSSRLRIEILKLTGARPMSIGEMVSELGKRGLEVKYRESVYKAAEKLVFAGLVEKYYDSSQKHIVYVLHRTRMKVDLKSGEISYS